MDENKPIIIQQVLNPRRGGGVTSEYISLMSSKLTDLYVFIPMILPAVHKGLSIKDIKFYYNFMKNIESDIVHIRGAGIDSLNAIIAAKILNKAKIYTVVHGMYSDLVYISKIKKLIAKMIIEPLIFILSDYISFVFDAKSKRTKYKKYRKKFLKHTYNRYPSIPVCINNLVFLKKEMNILSNEFVFIYVGRLSREKGLEFYCESIKNICSKNLSNIKYIFVGEGPYESEMRKILEIPIKLGSVIMVGNKENVYDYLKIADVFVNPSLHENHSISILEAIYCKKPVIVTDVGGNRETVSLNNYGIIVKPYNINELVNAMLAMLNPSFYSKILSNLNVIDERFKDDNVNSVIISNYNKILGDKNE